MYSKYEELLRRNGVKTSDVCRETGIDAGTFSHWKRGDYAPKQEKLVKIADYFGVPISYFYGDNTEDVVLSADEKKLLSFYSELNREGQELLLERASELMKLGYIKSSKTGVVGA